MKIEIKIIILIASSFLLGSLITLVLSKDEKNKVEYIYENTNYESYYRGYFDGYDKGSKDGTFACRLENAAQWMADKYQWEKCLEESK